MIIVNQSEFIDKKRWMDDSDFIYGHVDIRNANYRSVDIRNVNLYEADFPMINFWDAKLTNCSFIGQGIMFGETIDSEISSCKFININLNKASMLGVHFRNCHFSDIDTFKMDISESTVFENCSFKNVKVTYSYIKADFKNCEFEDVIFSTLRSDISIKKETTSFGIRIESNKMIRV